MGLDRRAIGHGYTAFFDAAGKESLAHPHPGFSNVKSLEVSFDLSRPTALSEMAFLMAGKNS
jgi:hypothetical protein